MFCQAPPQLAAGQANESSKQIATRQTGVVHCLVYLQQLNQRVLGFASQKLLADVAQVVALLVILEVIRRCHATTLQSLG